MSSKIFFDEEYLQRLQNSGSFSRFLKRYTTYKFIISNSTGCCLDFGCGDLTFLKFVKQSSKSKEMLWFGHDANPAIENLAHSIGIDYISNLSESARGFDTILCDNVLEHILDWRAVLSLLFAKVSTGGKIIIGLPCLAGYYHDSTHLSFITRFDIENYCNQGGFNLNKIYHYPLNSKIIELIFGSLSRHVLTYYLIQKND